MNYEEIIKTVCNYFNIPIDDIYKKSRKRELILARMICYKLIRGKQDFKKYKYNGYRISLAEIGKIFTLDHATVLNGINKLNNYLETEIQTKLYYDELLKTVENNILVTPDNFLNIQK